MFNLRMITVNRTALSIIANCNYLHIHHCHMSRAITARHFCVRAGNIQSTRCGRRRPGTSIHEQDPRAGLGLMDASVTTKQNKTPPELQQQQPLHICLLHLARTSANSSTSVLILVIQPQPAWSSEPQCSLRLY